jgi:thiol-disulfide isomerase/thioredoxin
MSDQRHPVARTARPRSCLRAGAALLAILVLAGCGQAGEVTAAPQSPTPAPTVLGPASPLPDTAAAADVTASPAPSAPAERPEWFDFEMTDVQTGETFTVNDFIGKVVLLEAMAVWCPTCRRQGDEVKRLHQLLGNPDDLVSISLDTDMGEDAATLKAYAEKLGYEWHLAVAPLLVARALGNLYSAQYLNPPVSPMLIIDRDGNVLGLPFGSVKSAESLQGVLEPLLEQS